jgi:hypothetical protein
VGVGLLPLALLLPKFGLFSSSLLSSFSPQRLYSSFHTLPFSVRSDDPGVTPKFFFLNAEGSISVYYLQIEYQRSNAQILANKIWSHADLARS